MKSKQVVTQIRLVRSLVGLAILAAASAASGQAQQQGEPQGQQQRQEDVRVAVAPSTPQQSAPQMSLNEVRVISVKADRVAEFEDLLKELGAAMSQRGEPGFEVWQVAFGDQATYHIVSPLQSFASLPQMQANPPMEPERWAGWLGRMQSTIDSQTLSVGQMHADLSITPEQQAGAAAPELMLLIRQALLPGKREAFVGWMRDELLPALRKTNMMGVFTNEMAFGTESRQWVFAVPLRTWAELDRPMPLYTSMGQQAAQQLLDRGDAMVERGETIVLRARPDLSMADAPGPNAAGANAAAGAELPRPAQ
jgi:hypothetical protein